MLMISAMECISSTCSLYKDWITKVYTYYKILFTGPNNQFRNHESEFSQMFCLFVIGFLLKTFRLVSKLLKIQNL